MLMASANTNISIASFTCTAIDIDKALATASMAIGSVAVSGLKVFYVFSFLKQDL